MASPTGKKKADFKLVILGAASIGKTSLIYRYLERKFDDQVSTIGAAFALKQWGPYNVAIWDTAGEERFAGLQSFYCRGAGAAILAFDITNEDTFHALRSRFVPLLSEAAEDVLVAVVGTKLDLLGSGAKRQVSQADAQQLTRELNPTRTLTQPLYFETSAMTGQGVDDVFDTMLGQVLPLATGAGTGDRSTPKSSSTVHLHDDKLQGGKAGCKC